MKRRLLTGLLSALMLVTLVPAAAQALRIEDGAITPTVNATKVAFAGHVWWVIGDGTSGVYPQTDHITLLAVNAEAAFKNVAFRKFSNQPGEGFSEWRIDAETPEDPFYYGNNPSGMPHWKTPNEYAGSNLQQKMEELASGFPAKEQAAITARTLDDVKGPAVANQKLWALSEDEWNTIGNDDVREYNTSIWWLRSPYTDTDKFKLEIGVQTGQASGRAMYDDFVHAANAARPALSLDLSSVLFTSTATDAAGKSLATVGNGLVVAQKATGRVKFTMQDSSQTLTVNATQDQTVQSGATLSFTYSGATTGQNQYVSCVLINARGVMKYYGKLADSSSASSGSLSIPLDGVANGTYTLQIFSEEANGILYTDFCSKPVTMTVKVQNGIGTVSNYGGTVAHAHDWSDTWSKDSTHHWHECEAANCPVTANSQKDGYAAHTYGDWEVTKEPTETTPGARERKCTVCGYTDTQAIGTVAHTHDWAVTWSKNSTHHWHECEAANCPVTADSQKDGYAAHTYGDWKVTKEPTETTPGTRERTCTACGYTDTQTIDAVEEVPATGDSRDVALLGALLLISACGLAGTALYGKKRRQAN